MLGNILGNTPSERRPSAESVHAIRTRWAEVYEAVDLEHSAERRVHPSMFVVPKPAEAPVMPTISVPSEVASNVINLASQREVRVLNEQEQRMADARSAAEEAHYEFNA